MNVAENSTDGNLCLKRRVAQRRDLRGMGINRLVHAVLHGYVFAELITKMTLRRNKVKLCYGSPDCSFLQKVA